MQYLTDWIQRRKRQREKKSERGTDIHSYNVLIDRCVANILGLGFMFTNPSAELFETNHATVSTYFALFPAFTYSIYVWRP